MFHGIGPEGPPVIVFTSLLSYGGDVLLITPIILAHRVAYDDDIEEASFVRRRVAQIAI